MQIVAQAPGEEHLKKHTITRSLFSLKGDIKWITLMIGGIFSTIYLQILPGEGGQDSWLFSRDLSRIYQKHALKNNLTFQLISESTKKIELKISGQNCLRSFSQESGIHRIQRIPPTENKGRVQTSIVNVLILDKPITQNIIIDKNKVRISYYKASGNGGQHRNRTLSAVRLQYEDLIVTCCDTRDQHKNKEIAFQKLKEILEKQQAQESYSLILKQQDKQNENKGKRGNYNRNYNFIRNEIIQDNKRYNLSRFLKGDLKEIYNE